MTTTNPPAMRTIYDPSGQPRRFPCTALKWLLDPNLPAEDRWFIRCPRCKHRAPLFGIHRSADQDCSAGAPVEQ
jgi:hypothetical protein